MANIEDRATFRSMVERRAFEAEQRAKREAEQQQRKAAAADQPRTALLNGVPVDWAALLAPAAPGAGVKGPKQVPDVSARRLAPAAPVKEAYSADELRRMDPTTRAAAEIANASGFRLIGVDAPPAADPRAFVLATPELRFWAARAADAPSEQERALARHELALRTGGRTVLVDDIADLSALRSLPAVSIAGPDDPRRVAVQLSERIRSRAAREATARAADAIASEAEAARQAAISTRRNEIYESLSSAAIEEHFARTGRPVNGEVDWAALVAQADAQAEAEFAGGAATQATNR